MNALHISAGRPSPLGVQDCQNGFNFAVFSRHAERIELVLYDDASSDSPLAIVDLSGPEPEIVRVGAGDVDAIG